MKKSVSYKEHLLEELKDIEFTVEYLNAAVEAGDRDAFLLALRNVIEAHGSITLVAKQAKLHRVSLHKMLSSGGNPTTESLLALFNVLGIRFKMIKQNRKDFKKAA